MNKIIYVLLLIAIIAQNGCIKSTTIGGDILKDNEIQVEFVDTFTLKAKSVYNDSFKVYPNAINSFLLGEFHDEDFGQTKASVYCNFRTTGSLPENNINDIDSIVLTMVFDTSRIFGETNEIHNISIYEVTESIERDSVYSNEKIAYNNTKIGEKDMTPYVDSVTVIEPKNDTLVYKNQIRILLDKTWGTKFLIDTNNLKNDTLFKEEVLKGLYIESKTVNSSMMSLSRIIDNKYTTRIDVYYSVNDTLKKSTFVNDKLFNHFENDYSTSKIKDFIGDYAIGDSLLFVQGTNGVKIEMDIPYLNILKGKNINKAELVLYTLEDIGASVKTPKKLVTKYLDEDGEVKYIDDYIFPKDSRNTDPNIYFGYKTKSKENGKELSKYIINITMHLKKLLKDDIYSTKLYIYPELRNIDPRFAIFRGVNRGDIKSKLKITYSNID